MEQLDWLVRLARQAARVPRVQRARLAIKATSARPVPWAQADRRANKVLVANLVRQGLKARRVTPESR